MTDTVSKASSFGRWTQIQHQKFLLGLELFGKDWKKIEKLIESRTSPQIRSHAQKYFQKSSEYLHELDSKRERGDDWEVTGEKRETVDKQKSPTSYYIKQMLRQPLLNKGFNFWEEFIDVSRMGMEGPFVSKGRIKSFEIWEERTTQKGNTWRVENKPE